MVDDIITVSKCGITSVTKNVTVNSFVKLKKLECSQSKCAQIHIQGKGKCNECPKLYVDEVEIRKSHKEKYLGDYITKNANPKETLEARKIRGYAILSEIKTLLCDIPLGRKRVEIGLSLRDAWFLNGCLFNSEVWGAFNDKDLKQLEVIDHMLLRTILGAQAKVT